jgi:DNA-binding MarR family transcriptional regulator
VRFATVEEAEQSLLPPGSGAVAAKERFTARIGGSDIEERGRRVGGSSFPTTQEQGTWFGDASRRADTVGVATHEAADVGTGLRFDVALAAAGGGLATLVAWLYSRIQRDRVLDQPTRRAIYDHLSKEPGLRIGTLAERVGVSYVSAQRHVKILERHCFVVGVGSGQVRWFPSRADVGQRARVAAIAASTPTARTLLRFVQANGPIPVPELRRRLRLAQSTACNTLLRLESAGLVERRRSGRAHVVAVPGSRGEMP